FMIERLERGRWALEVGARAEQLRIEQLEPTAPLRPTLVQFMHEPIDYELYSYSLGLEFSPGRHHTISFLVGNSARAPEVQELMSLGPHLATRSYSIGALIRGLDEEGVLEPETFNSVDLGWRFEGIAGALTVQAFLTEADDFIYQLNTGIFYDLAEQFFRFNCVRIEECLPVYEYTQADARLRGVEWQWQLPPVRVARGQLGFEIFGDFVRGRLADGEDLPRMPPLRAGLGANWVGRTISTELRVTHATAQNRPGLNETSTASYTDLSGGVTFSPRRGGDGGFLFFVRGRNLLNQQIRSSTSFLRSFAPEPGRSIEAGLRFDF
ncbi:MAG: TonB-dependent receptor, partial [Pseudomonadota bacterium]